MSHAEIPEIEDFPTTVLANVGESVDVYVHYTDPNMGPMQTSSHHMVNEVIDEMFRREGVRPDKDLKGICTLAARIAIAKLAASPGFTIEFGRSLDQPPREVVDVKLRPDEVTTRSAEVNTVSQQNNQ